VDNPFYRNRAELYSPAEVLEIYCPMPVMVPLAQPRNQVLYGGPGTGKSIVLKRLAYSAVRKNSNIPGPHPFFGVYVNCQRELAFLNPVCDATQSERVRSHIPNIEERMHAFMSHYISLTMACLVCREITEGEDFSGQKEEWAARLASGIAELCGLGVAYRGGLANLQADLDKKRASLRAHVANQTMFSEDVGDTCTLRDVAVFSEGLAQIISEHLKEFENGNWKIYFLLDQYDSFQEVTQRALNCLLRRGASFQVKASVRPYALYTLDCPDGTQLTPGDDFDTVYLAHTSEKEDDYATLMDEITAKMMRTLTGISCILEMTKPEPTSKTDFRTLCRLSGGLTRNFLELCALAVDFAQKEDVDWQHQGFSESFLTSATVILARRELERVSCIKGLPGPQVRWLVDGLCRRLRREGGTTLSPQIRVRTGMLFENELSAELTRVLKKAFEHGALRFISVKDCSLLTLPMQFVVNPVFFPRYNMPIGRV